MNHEPTTLGELERQSYRSRWKDGTLDLTGGLGVMAVGGSWSVDAFWGVGIVVPVLLTLWFVLRRRLVEPRIGRVRFRRARREAEGSGTRGSLLLGGGLLAAVLVFQVFQIRSGGGLDAWTRDWIAALPCALLALMALVTAAMTSLGRFVVYAAILLATASVATPLGMEPGPQILLGGSVITLAGLVRFARFLSDHPVPVTEGEDR
jgi:MFS family permease